MRRCPTALLDDQLADVEFEMYVGGVVHQVLVSFRVESVVCDGELLVGENHDRWVADHADELLDGSADCFGCGWCPGCVELAAPYHGALLEAG